MPVLRWIVASPAAPASNVFGLRGFRYTYAAVPDAGVLVPETIAHGTSRFGELVLRQRPREGAAASSLVCELICNGVFVMDSEDASTERRLASESLARVAHPENVVIGGLGLGFTLMEVIASSRPREIHVVEIEGLLVEWATQGFVPHGREALQDPRVQVHIADIHTYVDSLASNSVDLILLDVDNGPDFLVREANAGLYLAPFLATSRLTLRSGGLLAVWSSSRSARLLAALTEVFGPCDEVAFNVMRAGRQFEYFLYFASRR